MINLNKSELVTKYPVFLIFAQVIIFINFKISKTNLRRRLTSLIMITELN